MISVQYRALMNLTDEVFDVAIKELNKIQNAYKQACLQMELANIKRGNQLDDDLWKSFIDALNDDLNTPNAITTVLDTVKSINQNIRKRPVDFDQITKLVYTLERELYVLGIEFEPLKLTEQDKEMYTAWRKAVKEKDFITADQYRLTLQEKGII